MIDGYNVIYKIPEICVKLNQSLEEARKALALYLSDWKRQYSNADVIVVFDGKDAEFPDEKSVWIAGIHCIFTRSNETADDRIISMLSKYGDARDITVISEDNSIRNACRATGAGLKRVDFLMPRAKKKEKRDIGGNKDMHPEKMRGVTDYYRKHLREKGKI